MEKLKKLENWIFEFFWVFQCSVQSEVKKIILVKSSFEINAYILNRWVNSKAFQNWSRCIRKASTPNYGLFANVQLFLRTRFIFASSHSPPILNEKLTDLHIQRIDCRSTIAYQMQELPLVFLFILIITCIYVVKWNRFLQKEPLWKFSLNTHYFSGNKDRNLV